MPLFDPRQILLENHDARRTVRQTNRRAPYHTQIVTGRHLVYARTQGPAMGSIDGCAIWPIVIDHHERSYRFVGLAPRQRNGEYNINALSPGEWIVEPGLIYVRGDVEITGKADEGLPDLTG